MSYLEGMIPNRGYEGSLSLDLWCRQASDMRPREEFAPGYMVKLQCTPCSSTCVVSRDNGNGPACRYLKLGQVMDIDVDGRLAKVAWMSGLQGWWYLKDLVVVGMPVSNRFLSTHAERLDEVGDCFGKGSLAMTGSEL